MALSIALATRGRVDLLRQTIAITLSNMSRKDTRLVVIIDNDDQATVDAIPSLPQDKRISYAAGPRADSLGGKYNAIMSLAPADVYLAMVDYAPHVTPGFDQRILDAAETFPDGYAIVLNQVTQKPIPIDGFVLGLGHG